jgi:hypothetical protein
MDELTANRTLVKSPPELWAECSDAAALARHLGAFGDIRITRLEPETVVAWEGERASGTVLLQPSGWGTRVVLTARLTPAPAEEPAGEPDGEPVGGRDGEAARRADGGAVEGSEGGAAEEREDRPYAALEPAVVAPPAMRRRRSRGLLARLHEAFRWPRVSPPPVIVELPAIPSDPVTPPEPTGAVDDATRVEDPAPPDDSAPGEAPEPLDPEALLAAALDSLGQAHHRPFSRA